MRKIIMIILTAAFLWGYGAAGLAGAHCEIPCGIYHDKMRFEMLRENIQTIEKSINEINRLSSDDKKNYNQIVRWVVNKDNHADNIHHIIYQYFLAQRIKPVEEADSAEYKAYTTKLVLLHKIIVYSMKAKQSTDKENVKQLNTLVDEFEKAYFGEEHTHK